MCDNTEEGIYRRQREHRDVAESGVADVHVSPAGWRAVLHQAVEFEETGGGRVQRVGRRSAGVAGAAVGRKPLPDQSAVVLGTDAANIVDSSDWSGKKHVVLGGERIDGRKNL